MKLAFNKIIRAKYFSVIAWLVSFILALAAVGVLSSSCNILQHEDETVIADNVFVFNPESAEDEIIACDENSVTVKTIYGLTNGSILSGGITSKSPHGFLRKIQSIEKLDNGYKVNTTQAALVEAIKKCNLHYTANINSDGAYELIDNKNNDSKATAFVQQAFADGARIGNEFGFDSALFEGKFGYAVNFDLNIENWKIYIKITGEIYASADLKDFSKLDTGDIELWVPDLPDIAIMAGPVPIDITNDLSLTCNGVANLKSFKIKAGCTIHKIAGFEYSSDYGVRPVSEDKSSGPSMSIYAEKDTFRGDLTGTLKANYTAKLYGLAGFDVGVSLVDEFNMHLKKLQADENNNGCIHVPGLNWDLKGRLHNKVYIPISGSFVLGVEIDIFGLKFKTDELRKELFNTNDAITLMDEEKTFGNLDDDPDFNSVNQIALVLDVSGSMSGEPLEQLKSACRKFVNATINSKAEISIIGFESSAKVYIEDSADVDLLLKTIDDLKDLGGTNMEAGLIEAEKVFNKNNTSKKSIVLMSDGLPNEGKTDSGLVNYADQIKNKGITIYTLGFFHGITGSKSQPQKLLADISSSGYHYEADSPSSLQAFFDQIASQIKGISYILVEIKCPVDVTVTHNGETLSSVGTTLSSHKSFGSLNFIDEENSTDKAKILRLEEGPSYNLQIKGNGTGTMNYSISYLNAVGQYDDTRYFDNVQVNSKTKIDTKANLTDTNVMIVDYAGDGANVTKYQAASNQHATEVYDKPVESAQHGDAFVEEERSSGFFETIIKNISRWWNDISSALWFQVSQ